MATDEKHHAATPHHREEARKSGKNWQSQDAQNALGLMAAAAALLSYLDWMGPRLIHGARAIWGDMGHPHELGVAAAVAGHSFLWAVVPFTGGVLVWNVFIQFILRGFRITLKSPVDFNHMNPVSGIQRLLSRRTLWEVGKGMLKMLVLAALASLWVQRHLSALLALPHMTLVAAANQWGRWLWQLFLVLGAGFLLMGVLDAVWQRRQFERDLRMTTKEMRDEMKDTEGDPHLRSRRRGLRRRLAANSLKSVQTATVVITNPTHVAIAVQWAPQQNTPPMLVAKGIDDTALAIRAVAAESNVPIVENPPLARSMVSSPVGQPIPDFAWRPVAVILAHILRHHPR